MSAGRRAGRPLAGDRGTAKDTSSGIFAGRVAEGNRCNEPIDETRRDMARAAAALRSPDDELRDNALDALLHELTPEAAHALAERLKLYQAKRDQAMRDRESWPLRAAVEFIAYDRRGEGAGAGTCAAHRVAMEFSPPEMPEHGGVRVLIGADVAQAKAVQLLHEVAELVGECAPRAWDGLCASARANISTRPADNFDDEIPF